MKECTAKLPLFKYYRNRGISPADRRKTSYQMDFKGSVETDTGREDILTELVEDIHDNIDHSVDKIKEEHVANLANNHPSKVMVTYLYDDTQGVSPLV